MTEAEQFRPSLPWLPSHTSLSAVIARSSCDEAIHSSFVRRHGLLRCARNDGERPEAKNADLPVLLLDKGGKSVDILLQHLLKRLLGERALVVEGVANAV